MSVSPGPSDRVEVAYQIEQRFTRWRRELSVNGSKAFLGQGVARDEELAALKRENRQLRKERDFLREAATFFASDQKRSTR